MRRGGARLHGERSANIRGDAALGGALIRRGARRPAPARELRGPLYPWLMFARPERLAILVHPLTRSQTLDHTARVLWLGTPLPVDRALLEAVDAKLLASGRSEESIIEATKRH